MTLPQDYAERVYAGVLGKIIGVYLGRPFEGWSYEQIMAKLGEVSYYVHEQLGAPLIVTDDDISGTFTFLRALPDYGTSRDLTPAQIGETWLNYIIERRTILWWGGMGNSTEHTAYLRLKHGIAAPASGAIATNGKVVAEQIGSQIFIDGWAMVAPGDPELAVDLARRASSVSHDGEAIYGAQVLAAMESLAFVEPKLDKLLDAAVGFIPRDSVISRLINDIREWHAEFPDWRTTREQIAANYGYDKFGGNCHMVPNHALIHLGLLYGGDDFQKALMITNTAGWDTDCNSGNVGCLLGIKNGLAVIDAGPDWRGPVADRLYLPTADGGRAISDAVQESYRVINMGRQLAGATPLVPKQGARFHFELPGSVQGFLIDPASQGVGKLENVLGHSLRGTRSLALQIEQLAAGQELRLSSATFVPPAAKDMPGYALMASPTIYPGQTLRARLEADSANPTALNVRLLLQVYGADDQLEPRYGAAVTLQPDSAEELVWRIPVLDGQPIAAVGVAVSAVDDAASHGTIYLDQLGWDGEPDVAFGRPSSGGSMWRQAWVNGIDQFDAWVPETYRLVQNEGTGLLIQGTREWRDYAFEARITPHLAAACGIGVRVQGMRRYVALLLRKLPDGSQRIHLETRLGDAVEWVSSDQSWELYQSYRLRLEVRGHRLRALVDGIPLLELAHVPDALDSGAVALICEEGRAAFDDVAVHPLE